MADAKDDYEKFVEKSIRREIKNKKLSHRTPGPLDTIHAVPDDSERTKYAKGGMVKGKKR
jgi:hypothetical protein